jgi:chemotaxis protein CheY-P-specific phosphatase CheC
VAIVSVIVRWLTRALTYQPPNRGQLNDPAHDRLWRTYAGIPTHSYEDHYDTGWNGSTTEDFHTGLSKTISSDMTDEPSSSPSGTTDESLESSIDEMMNLMGGGRSTARRRDSLSPPLEVIFVATPSSYPKDHWTELCCSSMDTAFVELLAVQGEYRERLEKSSLTVDEFDSMFSQMLTSLGTMQSRILLATSQMSSELHGLREKTSPKR